MEEQKQFKVGDRVRMKRTVCFDYITFEKGCVGEVVSDETDRGTCFVLMKNAENGTVISHFISTSNLELIDNKTAFLSELKGLLEKYGACIYDYEQYKLIIDFDNGDSVSWYWGNKPIRECALTADNIMDYDKE